MKEKNVTSMAHDGTVYTITNPVFLSLANRQEQNSYDWFRQQQLEARGSGDVFEEGLYQYGTAILLYQCGIYTDALYFIQECGNCVAEVMGDEQLVTQFQLWLQIETAYIQIHLEEYDEVNRILTALIRLPDLAALTDRIQLKELPTEELKHHFLVCLALCAAHYNHQEQFCRYTDMLCTYSMHAIEMRHFDEYFYMAMYAVSHDLPKSAKVLIDRMATFCSALHLSRFERLYQNILYRYSTAVQDEAAAEKALAAYEACTVRREEEVLREKRAYLENKERIFHQEALQERMRSRLQEVRVAAESDPLTGLANRYRLNSYGMQAFNEAVRNHTSLGVILLDIDHFKQCNDRFGHLMGDRCLKLCGKTLKHLTKDSFAARYGGDEFVIIMKHVKITDMLLFSAKLAKRLQTESASVEELAPRGLTVSQGLLLAEPTSDMTWVDYIHAADNALYQGKREGRNCISIGTIA